MARNVEGGSSLFQQKLDDVELFATGAEGTEDLGETINMRYELSTPQKYFAQVKSKDDEKAAESEDEDEEQQVAILSQRRRRADPPKKEEKKDAAPAPVVFDPPEKVQDHFDSAHSPTRTTYYDGKETAALRNENEDEGQTLGQQDEEASAPDDDSDDNNEE